MSGAPIESLATRSREDAFKDSDFVANQNPAVNLTHGYTLERLTRPLTSRPK
jgi:hypothetical protein